MRRYNILALSTYSIEKPLGGGQVVVSGIYKNLSNYFDIILLSIVTSDKGRKTVTIKPGLRNIIIPMSLKEKKALWDMERKYQIGLSDYIHIDNISLSTEYVEEFRRLSKWADIIIFVHPYLTRLLELEEISKKRIIYHAIDIELLQKKGLYKDYPELLNNVRITEARACRYADAIFTTCETERIKLEELYPEHTDGKDIFIIPNGIDVNKVPFITRSEHSNMKKNYNGLLHKIICLFVGSWHPPNLEALEFIIRELAPKNIDIQYFVLGSVREYFFNKYTEIPPNLQLFGVLDEDEKWELYKLADFAINPMFSGAGTNVKMLEYMAAGLPIITTEFGARGIESARFCYFENAEEFFIAVDTLTQNSQLKQDMIMHNLDIVRQGYNVSNIAIKVRDLIYKELLDDYNSYLIDRLSDELYDIGISRDTGLIDRAAYELSRLMES